MKKEKKYKVKLNLTADQISLLRGIIFVEHEWYREQSRQNEKEGITWDDDIEKGLENIRPIHVQVENIYKNFERRF